MKATLERSVAFYYTLEIVCERGYNGYKKSKRGIAYERRYL